MIQKENIFRLNDKKIGIYSFSIMGQGKIENQDSFSIYYDDEQIIITLADGLGSADFSKEGSLKIVDIAIEELKNRTNYDDLYLNIKNKWINSIQGNPDVYDTTIKFIKITKDNIYYGGVGDGWIAINGSEYKSLTAENVFSNQTDSILSYSLNEKFKINNITNNFTSMLISTDGFSEDMEKDQGSELLKAIEENIKTNSDGFINEMCETLEKWPIKTNKDDKTVIFIVNLGE